MNKQFAYTIIVVAYLIYFLMRYAAKGEKENIVIDFFLHIYFFCATMLLGMTLVL